MYERTQPSSHRVGDDFLRRMLNGELTEKSNRMQMPTTGTRTSCGCEERETRERSAMPDCNACPDPPSPTMPSLAMVYSPVQAWQGILSPDEGLRHGSIFSELILPLEATPHKGDKEVNPRRAL